MCACTPEKRTPFCGKAGCQWPAQAHDLPAEAPKGVERRTVRYRCGVRVESDGTGPGTRLIAADGTPLDMRDVMSVTWQCDNKGSRLLVEYRLAPISAAVRPKREGAA
jgi:hypothetical protein